MDDGREMRLKHALKPNDAIFPYLSDEPRKDAEWKDEVPGYIAR